MPLRILGVVALVGSGLWAVFADEIVPSWAWFLAKTYLLVFVLVWFRGTLPRLRVDQLMGLAWKFFLPLTLINIVAAALWMALPGFQGGLLTFILLSLSAWWLTRLNNPAPLQPRTYILVE